MRLVSSACVGDLTSDGLRDASALTDLLDLGPDHCLQDFNCADASFFGNLRQGMTISDVVDIMEKSGFIDGISAADFRLAIETKRRQHLLKMRDGRRLLISMSKQTENGIRIQAIDISNVIDDLLRSNRDTVTGLPNKEQLLAALEKASEQQGANSFPVLLYFAFDTSAAADSRDQDTIDTIIRLAAGRISKRLSQRHTAFRCGNGVVVTDVSSDQPQTAILLAKDIVDLLERSFLINGHTYHIRVNVGIAMPTAEASGEALVHNAMLAARKAAEIVGSNVKVYTETMAREALRRRELEAALRRALVLEEFWVAYQPQFEIDGRRLIGFEALVRWADPEKGTISPGDFIPLAEETGLIQDLGAWVLKTACKEAASWPSSMAISVNLSPLQMKTRGIVEVVKNALAESRLEPARLDLEITENSLIDDAGTVRAILVELKELGVKVSIDDFGTGYSSLSYLQNFEFDKIKIDQSFVRNLETSADSRAIVSAITALSKALGIATIAEGVETEHQLQIIADMGCTQVQGYLTGRPVPSLDLSPLFKIV